MSTKYDVALSFAGDDRSIARQIAESLTEENLNVFFDEYSSAELWGQNLFDYLEKVYADSRLCIVLLSKSYVEGQWTQNELRSLIAHSKKRPSFSILPLHIDDAPIPRDLANVRYVQWDSVSPQDLTRMVKERLASLAPPKSETPQEKIHVIRRETEWSVKREGKTRATSVHKTKAEAITSARKLAQQRGNSVVVVHGADGAIESQEQFPKE